MKIKNAKFLTSAASKQGLLTDQVPEVAFVGRSNVGKSSLINTLTNQNKLAKTSQTPGRTRLVNYFAVNNDQLRFVDLPGYGYAKASKTQQQEWSALIEQYLNTSQNLKVLLLLVDIRHQPTSLDVTMLSFAFATGKPCIIVATKCDKIAKSKIYNNLIMLSKSLKVGIENIVAFSSQTKQGASALLQKIQTYLT